MKKSLLLSSLFLASFAKPEKPRPALLNQDKKPVHWEFSSKKVDDTTYEVHFTATMGKDKGENGEELPYHIYAQRTNFGDPTRFTFDKNPLITPDGNPMENGQIVDKYDSGVLDSVRYYEANVEFVERVTVQKDAKVALTGNVHFLACTKEHCEPPKTETFSIELH